MNKIIAQSFPSPRSIFWLIVGTLILVAVVKYNGIDMRYRSLLLFYQNPSLLLNDWYYTDSIYIRTSSFYSLFSLMGIPIEDNLVSALLYALFAAAVLYSSYRLVLEHFEPESRETALLVVLLGCFLTAKFVSTTQASILSSWAAPNFPTGVAHVIAYISLYFLISRRIFVACLLITLAISIAIKGYFIIVPIAGLYILLNPDISNRNFAFVAIPLAYVLITAGRSDIGGLSYEALVKLCEVAIWREGVDAAPSLWQLSTLIIFSSTFLVAPFLIRQFGDQSLRSFAWSTLVVSFSVFLFGYFYSLGGYKLYPNPMLLLIAPSRAMNFYTLIFCLMFFSWALKTQALVLYEKIAAVLSLFVLKFTLTGIAAASTFAVIGIAMPKALRHFCGVEITNMAILRKTSEFFRKTPLTLLITLLILLFIAVRGPDSYPGLTNIDPIAYKHINVWSGRIFADDETWQAYKALKKTSGKDPLLAYYQPYNKAGKYKTNNTLNLVSEKPQFEADPSHHYLSPEKWDEGFLRELVVGELTRYLNKGKPIQGTIIGKVADRKVGDLHNIDTTFEKFFRERSASIFVPFELDDLFPSYLPRLRVNGFVLIRFPYRAVSQLSVVI